MEKLYLKLSTQSWKSWQLSAMESVKRINRIQKGQLFKYSLAMCQSGTFSSVQSGQWGEAGPPHDQPRGMARWLSPERMAAAWPLQPLLATPPAARMAQRPSLAASTFVGTDSSNTDSQFFNTESKHMKF